MKERLLEGFDNVVDFDLSRPKPPPGCERVAAGISYEACVREGLRMLREQHGEEVASVVRLAAYYDFLCEPSRSTNRSRDGDDLHVRQGLLAHHAIGLLVGAGVIYSVLFNVASRQWWSIRHHASLGSVPQRPGMWGRGRLCAHASETERTEYDAFDPRMPLESKATR